MALYSIDDSNKQKKENSIGTKEYWALFKRYQGTSLHDLLKDEIGKHLPSSEEINSRHLGKSILSGISISKQEISDEQLGALYGMVLWHTIAELDQDWRFLKEAKSHPEDKSGMIYFKDKS
jgi:hypothetical protein